MALLERILNASSNPGDVVLDPFCGCGTTVHAAQKLGRAWIGIDITHLAIGLIEKRLRDAYRERPQDLQFITHGVPQDLEGAKNLAARGRDDKNYYFEFEKWALSLINAQPGNLSKKGADKGIDGNLYFGAKHEGRAIVSVKAGDNVGVAMIRDLRGVIEREGGGDWRVSDAGRAITPDDHRGGGGGAICLAGVRGGDRAAHPDCHNRRSHGLAGPGGAPARARGWRLQARGAGGRHPVAGGVGFVTCGWACPPPPPSPPHPSPRGGGRGNHARAVLGCAGQPAHMPVTAMLQTLTSLGTIFI